MLTMRHLFAAIASCFAGLSAASHAQLAVPLGDFAPGLSSQVNSSNPAGFIVIGDRVAFIAKPAAEEAALFVCNPDGSAARAVRSLNQSSVSPVMLGSFRGQALVGLGAETIRNQLWAIDLDTGDARLLHTAPFGVTYVEVQPLGDDTIIVMHYSSCGGCGGSVVRIAGATGEASVVDVAASFVTSASTPGAATIGGRVLFSTLQGGLWGTDGTPAGTTMISQLGSPFSQPRALVNLADVVVFLATNAREASGVWRTDGSEAGTVLLAADGSVSSPLGSVLGYRVGDRAVFVEGGIVLTSDGTPEGTGRVRFGDGSIISGAAALGVVGARGAARLVFTASVDGSTRLCATDGGLDSAVTLSDAALGSVAPITQGVGAPNPPRICALQRPPGSLSNRVGGLISTDGTRAGTTISPLSFSFFFNSSSGAVATYAGLLFAGGLNDIELAFAGAGSPAPVVAADLFPPSGQGGVVFGPAIGGRMVLAVGGNLVTTDGTPAGSRRVGAVSVYASGDGTFGRLPDGRVVFSGDDPVQGRGIFVTDGDDEGTVLIPATAGQRFGTQFTAIAGGVYYAAADPSDNRARIYRTDGTSVGSRVAYSGEELRPSVYGITSAGGALYFIYGDLSAQLVLYRIDLANDAVTSIGPIGSPGSSGRLLGSTSSFLFYAAESIQGSTLARVSLSTGQVRTSAALVVGQTVSQDSFIYRDPSSNRLARSVSSGSQTLVTPVRSPGGSSVPPRQLVASLASSIIFAGYDAAAGVELWSYDNASGASARLTDIWPGPADGGIQRVQALGDRVVFTARGPSRGRELYVTDGTPAGTRRLTDIRPGASGCIGVESSSSANFARLGHLVLLGADDGVHGEEPWAVSLCLADFNSDGLTDPDDLAGFIACYFASPPCPETDVNADGAADPDDLSDYITAYFTSNCD